MPRNFNIGRFALLVLIALVGGGCRYATRPLPDGGCEHQLPLHDGGFEWVQAGDDCGCANVSTQLVDSRGRELLTCVPRCNLEPDECGQTTACYGRGCCVWSPSQFNACVRR